MAQSNTWRRWVSDRIDEYLDAEPNAVAPDLAARVRSEMPFGLASDSVYAAIYAQVVRRLKDRGFRRRASGSYIPMVQMELDGIVEWAKAQLARADALRSSTAAGIEEWLDQHPGCGLTVSQILVMAEDDHAGGHGAAPA